jgi:hypothetical protein
MSATTFTFECCCCRKQLNQLFRCTCPSCQDHRCFQCMASHIAAKTCAYGRADKLNVRIPGGSAARPKGLRALFVVIFAPIGALVIGVFVFGLICAALDALRSHGV